MKRSFLALLMLFAGVIATAQQPRSGNVKAAKSAAQPRNLEIGDNVPDIYVPKIINGDKRSLHVADFKDKLLIIDFWATTCSGCVAALPRLDSLQKEFGDQIKILTATSEPELFTSDFLKKDKHINGKLIETVVDDKILLKWFNYRFISHDVWIYKGKVVAFTDPQYVSVPNIKLVLSGAKNDFPVKNDMQPEFSHKKTFLQVDRGQYNWKQGPVKYAALFGFRDNTGLINKPFGSAIDTIRHTVRHYLVNFDIRSAYMFYWEMIRHPGDSLAGGLVPLNRFIYDVKDTSRFSFDRIIPGTTELEWHRKYDYCFESVMPYTGQSEAEQAKAVIADLDHVFNLHGRWEKRTVKCLVITQKETDDQVKQKRALVASQYAFFDITGRYNEAAKDKLSKTTGVGKEVSLNEFFIGDCNWIVQKLPFEFDSAYKGTIILPPASFTDVQSLRKGLQANGFDLVETEKETNMFVFTDNNNQ
jgi:thiol-disulfide isomerase/thioredoxin